MKKLMKAQMGKIVKGAIKAVAKEAKPAAKVVKPMLDVSKKEVSNAVALSERARLKAHLESLSKKKQMGGPAKLTPSKPVNFKEAKAKAKYNPNLREQKERAEKNTPEYKIKNFKPYKPIVAKKGGAVKTKLKK